MRALLMTLFALLLLLPTLAPAQGVATLVADSLEVAPPGPNGARLTAAGNVEVFYDGTRLTAAAVSYDAAADRLTITGPILIRAADGTILAADSASLDPRLQNGLLRGARLVLDQQLQLAANRIDRVEGRYSQLSQVAATSCHVCAGRPPLWEIRARRVVHDSVAQQLYFDNATLRVAGVPVLWVPQMRLPAPTLTRATGLLIPRVRTTDQLGLGVKLPYFIRLGDHRDLTLTPYVSPATRTIEARYRQAFANGDIILRGALTRDSIRPGGERSYVFAEGAFDLGRDFRLDFATETASDPAYLLDYGYSDKDRLTSSVLLTRVRADDLLMARIAGYDSLRAGETDATLPPLLAEVAYERRFYPERPGGTLDLRVDGDAFWRTVDTPGDAGRDLGRLGLGAVWRRDWVTGPGILVGLRAGVGLDSFVVADDPTYARQSLRLRPATSVTLRWPLMRQFPGGATHVIEPQVALGWAAVRGARLPNEDSALIEFDEANLLSLSYFPGQDAASQGWRAAAGLRWTRMGPQGAYGTLTLGRVFAAEAESGFSAASGLDGTTSDWLIAGQIDLPGGFALRARSLFDDGLDFGKTDARLAWANDRLTLGAAYVWLPADADEARGAPISEWTLDAAYAIDTRWKISADGRYDIVADRPARAGIGLGWRSECVTVDLSIGRRYTSSTVVEPSTDFDLAVNLTGFSAGRASRAQPGSCRN